MKRTLIAALIAAGLATTPALASSGQFELDISFDRADFATEEGARAEYARIREEIAKQCEVEDESQFTTRVAEQICMNRTMYKVIRAIDDDNLTAVHKASK